jgi:osmoprotectant transport system ATP-binding protein
MVELIGVSKRYGDHEVLHRLDLTIEPNLVTALIGPSGCGKSTLLRIVLGLIQPTTGTVAVDGRIVNAESAQSIRQRIGYVVQDGGLFPHLTARENVCLMPRYLEMPTDRLIQRLDELTELTQIRPALLDRYPAELSGGQRQRIGLMRALVLDPELLLLDEPLGALDPLVRAALQTDLRHIFQVRGKTVIFVTHDMGEAAYLADNIVLLREGRVVQQGTLSEFQRNPADSFVTDFLSAQRQVGAIL